MAFNIMDLIKDQVTDSITDQLGGLLGEKSDVTQSAISGAIPAILSGLAGTASDAKGAESLFNAVNDHDDSLLDSLGDLLGGDQSGSMIEMGTKMLGGLMGNSGLGSIVGALAGFSGMGKKSSSSLVGLLAPIVIGVIKRKIFGGNSGGTIGALTSLFAGQKDNIASAMPSGMNDQLNTSGFFDRLESAVETGGDVVDKVQETASEAASGGKSMMSKMLPIIIIAAVAYFAFQMFGGGGDAKQTSQTEMSTEMPDFSKQIGSIFTNSGDTFSKIVDIESATAQLPNLKSIVTDVEGFSGAFVGLGDDLKAPVITLAKDAFSELQPIVDKVLNIEGVGDIIKPTTDSLMEQLNQLIQ